MTASSAVVSRFRTPIKPVRMLCQSARGARFAPRHVDHHAGHAEQIEGMPPRQGTA